MAARPHHDSDERDPAFERVIFFSDGIFAIAITLLTLNIRLPHIDPANVGTELPNAVISLIPSILVYALSYEVIGIYWIAHHRMFRWINRYNYQLVRFNLLFLFFIAFLPVPTSVLGDYWNAPVTNVFYALSIGLVGISEFLLWRYAAAHQMVDSSQTPRDITYFGIRILVPTAVFLLSIPIVYAIPDYGKFFWLLIVVIMPLVARRFAQEVQKRAQGN